MAETAEHSKAALVSVVDKLKLGTFMAKDVIAEATARAAAVDWLAVSADHGIPTTKAGQWSALAYYDVVVFVDDSRSMMTDEGGSRILALKAILKRLAAIATLVDEDGMQMVTMNNALSVDNVTDPAQIDRIVDGIKWQGMTPIGTQLNNKVLKPMIGNAKTGKMKKPVIIYVITDGAPTAEPRDTMVKAIRTTADAMRLAKRANAFAFQFIQVTATVSPPCRARTIHPLTIPTPGLAGGQRRGGQQVPG
jgi:Mg-chelatase subunit ChlD